MVEGAANTVRKQLPASFPSWPFMSQARICPSLVQNSMTPVLT